jgi:two-component sensor histidine kinase
MHRWISTINRTALATRAIPVPVRYLITAAVVVLVAWIWITWGGGAERYPLLAFIPVILVCGALLDRGNGFLATALSAALTDYYALPPIRSMEIHGAGDQAAFGLFVFVGIIISIVVEALHVGFVELAKEHERARDAVKDREVLLHELAHRTRNDFANVVTLLNLQARQASGEAREALTSAAERVQTIARVHRRLELHDARVVVDSKSYIEELCADLRLSRIAMRPIALECRAESHPLNLEKAVPLGLIINESVTNATKHAFPDERSGIINVSFERMGDVYELTVADNGIGRNETSGDGGLGNRLMQMLAAQLGSHVDVKALNPGTAVVVSIVVKTAAKHDARAPSAAIEGAQ